jgi:hypothetical protein
MATKPTSLLDIFEKNRINLQDASTKSRAWFEQQVLLLNRKRLTPNKVLQSEATQLRQQIYPGYLYMFMYDPKLKETLPYYDMFPLVFPYAKFQGGFMGLNMHYLPYPLRVTLLDRLMTFANNKKMDETTRIKYSWDLINGMSRFKPAQPCIKHYLTDHVRSPFRRIESYDWATAMLLPVERFQGATKEQVWADSRRMIR